MVVRALLAVALVLLAGSGIAGGLLLWAPWDKEPDDFCQQAAVWHAAQDPFQRQTNKIGGLEGDGLSVANAMFEDSADVVLPTAQSQHQQDIRGVMRDTVRAEEELLSEASILNSLREADYDGDQIIAAYRRAEEKRLELNDLLREVNAMLGAECGLPPLPIYSD